MTANEWTAVWVGAPIVVPVVLTWAFSRLDFSAYRLRRIEIQLKQVELVEKLIQLKQTEAIDGSHLPWNRLEQTLKRILQSLERPDVPPITEKEIKELALWRRITMIYPLASRNARNERQLSYMAAGFLLLTITSVMLQGLTHVPVERQTSKTAFVVITESSFIMTLWWRFLAERNEARKRREIQEAKTTESV